MAEWEKTFHVNVKVRRNLLRYYCRMLLMAKQPVFLSAQVIAPVMMEQGNGVFINITRSKF